MTEKKSSL